MQKKLRLHELHKSKGAKFVDFSGYLMPVQYEGIIAEHKHVRNEVGLFDVSHMGEIEITGKDSLAYLENLTTNYVENLQRGDAHYTTMLYDHGGTVDDFILYCFEPRKKYLAIVNASNIEKDLNWMNSNTAKLDVDVINKSDKFGLFALQGPKSEIFLNPLCKDDISKLKPFKFLETVLQGCEVMISRTGYTGEKGFEICFDQKYAQEIWNSYFNRSHLNTLKLIGLGARNTLRMEMCYPLYGHELSESINPLEIGFGWIVKFNKKDFIGKKASMEIKKLSKRKMIAFKVDNEKVVVREKASIFDQDGNEVGYTCSGTISPMLNTPIGTALVEKNALRSSSQSLYAEVRNKLVLLILVHPPFLKPHC